MQCARQDQDKKAERKLLEKEKATKQKHKMQKPDSKIIQYLLLEI